MPDRTLFGDTYVGRMRRLVDNCVREAERRHAPAVEAEHVLLAAAADGGTPAARVLADAGLTYDAIVVALREERLRSLAAVGVTPLDAQQLIVTPRTSAPVWGASVATARSGERPGPAGSRRRAREIALLIGILEAELGTVPRALAMAGIDRNAVIASLEQL